jgi:ribosome-associated protein
VPGVGAVDDLIAETVRRVSVRGGGSAAPPAASAPPAAPRPRAADAEADARLTAQVKKGVAALLDKKAEKLVVLNLNGLTAMSDYFVLATATSDRQSQALADAVEAALRTEGRRPLSVEGYQSGTWILLDYGDVVFHIFHDVARRFYGLERLWGDAPDLTPHFS